MLIQYKLYVHLFRRPIFAQDMLPLSSHEVVIAQHPSGLTLLGRDMAQEDAFVEEAQNKFQADQEQGMLWLFSEVVSRPPQ
jgi:hypothetical protein